MQFLEKLWKILENKDILNQLQQKKLRNYLESKSSFHTTKFFTENLLAIEMKIKTNDIYYDTAEDVENRFDTSNYELDRPLPKGKHKQVIGVLKVELGIKVMVKFVGLRAKTYTYLTDERCEEKKTKDRKRWVIEKNINLKIIKTVQKQLNIIMKENIWKKTKFKQIVSKKNK